MFLVNPLMTRSTKISPSSHFLTVFLFSWASNSLMFSLCLFQTIYLLLAVPSPILFLPHVLMISMINPPSPLLHISLDITCALLCCLPYVLSFLTVLMIPFYFSGFFNSYLKLNTDRCKYSTLRSTNEWEHATFVFSGLDDVYFIHYNVFYHLKYTWQFTFP